MSDSSLYVSIARKLEVIKVIIVVVVRLLFVVVVKGAVR